MQEAKKRLSQYGLNEVRLAPRFTLLKLLWRQFASPLVAILVVGMILSLVLNEKADAIVILIVIILNATLGFLQEYKAEKAIAALKELIALQATVLRDGAPLKIDARTIVPGDILIVQEGDKLAADARLIEIHELQTQEAPLTGESQPILKRIAALAEKVLLADRKNMIYEGTIITKGKGKAVVIATGMGTEMGKIASLMEKLEEEPTPLQLQLRRLSVYITALIVAIALFVFIAGVWYGNPFQVMILTALALAVAAIPEGLPAVITIALASGVRTMAKKNALVRRLPSIETLGSVNVICTDKTGTLTKNEMTVTKIWVDGEIYNVDGVGYSSKGSFFLHGKAVSSRSLLPLLKAGALCNDAHVAEIEGKRRIVGDPTEAALLISAEKAGLVISQSHNADFRVDEILFSSERKRMTTIHHAGHSTISYIKGAPDVIVKRCNRILWNGKVKPFTPALKKEVQAQTKAFAGEALRVLGFATNDAGTRRAAVEKDMIFLGLQAMIDPPRDEAKDAVQRCLKAGIKVIMITGDHLDTAKAIAQEIGISGKAVSAEQLEKTDWESQIDEIGVFARVNPEHKLWIITALKKRGYIVAMTGDGVNDAPALKKADIGVAMGIAGTDVAREASDIILADDNFASIVNAVEEGRGIFDNIKKFFGFLFSGNIGEVGIVTIAIVAGLPLPLAPLLILFINLVTDGLPALALGVDPFEPGAMTRPPRKNGDALYKRLFPFLVGYPLLMIASTLLVFVWKLNTGGPLKAATMAFLMVVMFELFQAYAARSVRYPSLKVGLFQNKYLMLATLASFILTLVVIYVPSLQVVFETTALTLREFVIVAAISSLGFFYLELHKWWRSRKEKG